MIFPRFSQTQLNDFLHNKPTTIFKFIHGKTQMQLNYKAIFKKLSINKYNIEHFFLFIIIIFFIIQLIISYTQCFILKTFIIECLICVCLISLFIISLIPSIKVKKHSFLIITWLLYFCFFIQSMFVIICLSSEISSISNEKTKLVLTKIKSHKMYFSILSNHFVVSLFIKIHSYMNFSHFAILFLLDVFYWLNMVLFTYDFYYEMFFMGILDCYLFSNEIKNELLHMKMYFMFLKEKAEKIESDNIIKDTKIGFYKCKIGYQKDAPINVEDLILEINNYKEKEQKERERVLEGLNQNNAVKELGNNVNGRQYKIEIEEMNDVVEKEFKFCIDYEMQDNNDKVVNNKLHIKYDSNDNEEYKNSNYDDENDDNEDNNSGSYSSKENNNVNDMFKSKDQYETFIFQSSKHNNKFNNCQDNNSLGGFLNVNDNSNAVDINYKNFKPKNKSIFYSNMGGLPKVSLAAIGMGSPISNINQNMKPSRTITSKSNPKQHVKKYLRSRGIYKKVKEIDVNESTTKSRAKTLIEYIIEEIQKLRKSEMSSFKNLGLFKNKFNKCLFRIFIKITKLSTETNPCQFQLIFIEVLKNKDKYKQKIEGVYKNLIMSKISNEFREGITTIINILNSVKTMRQTEQSFTNTIKHLKYTSVGPTVHNLLTIPHDIAVNRYSSSSSLLSPNYAFTISSHTLNKLAIISECVLIIVADLSEYVSIKSSVMSFHNNDSNKSFFSLLDFKVFLEEAGHFYVGLFRKTISFKLELHSKLYDIKILINELKLKQIVTNLISNAIKQTPNNKIVTVKLFPDEDNHCAGTDIGLQDHKEGGLLDSSSDSQLSLTNKKTHKMVDTSIYVDKQEEVISERSEKKKKESKKHRILKINIIVEDQGKGLPEQLFIEMNKPNASDTDIQDSFHTHVSEDFHMTSMNNYISKKGLNSGLKIIQKLSKEINADVSCEYIYEKKETEENLINNDNTPTKKKILGTKFKVALLTQYKKFKIKQTPKHNLNNTNINVSSFPQNMKESPTFYKVPRNHTDHHHLSINNNKNMLIQGIVKLKPSMKQLISNEDPIFNSNITQTSIQDLKGDYRQESAENNSFSFKKSYTINYRNKDVNNIHVTNNTKIDSIQIYNFDKSKVYPPFLPQTSLEDSINHTLLCNKTYRAHNEDPLFHKKTSLSLLLNNKNFYQHKTQKQQKRVHYNYHHFNHHEGHLASNDSVFQKRITNRFSTKPVQRKYSSVYVTKNSYRSHSSRSKSSLHNNNAKHILHNNAHDNENASSEGTAISTKIIVVDDSINHRTNLENLIRRYFKKKKTQCVIVSFEDGAELLNELYVEMNNNDGTPITKMIFCDEQMKFINGSQCYNIMKQSDIKGTCNIKVPFILCSADASNLRTQLNSIRPQYIYDKPLSIGDIEYIFTSLTSSTVDGDNLG